MHSGLLLLTLASILLIVIMVTCFICFVRSRRKEDEELMEQVQYTNHQRHQQQLAADQQQLMAQQMTPQRSKLSPSPSLDNTMINDIRQQQQHNYSQPLAAYRAGNPYAPGMQQTGASPYHNQQQGAGAVLGGGPAGSPRGCETRTDITQQINSAIIGSSEAEFQNDFIQVFPMYQIAPQPEKNTTPYLT